MDYMPVFTKGQDCFLNALFSFGLVLSVQAGAVVSTVCTITLGCSFSLCSYASQSKYPTMKDNSLLCVSYGLCKWSIEKDRQWDFVFEQGACFYDISFDSKHARVNRERHRYSFLSINPEKTLELVY